MSVKYRQFLSGKLRQKNIYQIFYCKCKKRANRNNECSIVKPFPRLCNTSCNRKMFVKWFLAEFLLTQNGLSSQTYFFFIFFSRFFLTFEFIIKNKSYRCAVKLHQNTSGSIISCNFNKKKDFAVCRALHKNSKEIQCKIQITTTRPFGFLLNFCSL